MCRPRGQEAGRVRRGCLKKLAAAFRYDISRKAGDDWLAKIAREHPDEFPAEAVPKRPPEARSEIWHEFYWRAWSALRFDRPYGAMGGEMPVSFLALDAYARRYGIEGEAFDRFHKFMTAIDGEWLAYVAEKAKAREEGSGK